MMGLPLFIIAADRSTLFEDPDYITDGTVAMACCLFLLCCPKKPPMIFMNLYACCCRYYRSVCSGCWVTAPLAHIEIDGNTDNYSQTIELTNRGSLPWMSSSSELAEADPVDRRGTVDAPGPLYAVVDGIAAQLETNHHGSKRPSRLVVDIPDTLTQKNLRMSTVMGK